MRRDPHPLTIDTRRALCGPLTIDGRPCVVSNARGRFAHVIEPDGATVEYSWLAIARRRGVALRDRFGEVTR